MGRDEPPYLYEQAGSHNPNTPYTQFNPKAASQATYQALVDRSLPKPKQSGPLINFNRHPDSYMAVPGQRSSVPPMPENTKRKVTTLRWVQLGLRVFTSLAAIGLLVATSTLTNIEGAMTYLLRFPPAWDTLISLYAVYHLCRPAKSRTPGSSASYHIFALFMDGGLMPLYVLVAWAAYLQYKTQSGTGERWATVFSSNVALNDTLFATFAGATGIGGMHLISAILDIWLIILFRKISNLPPDMNPLEDNLTSRRISKHKHKNSELSLSSQASTFIGSEKKTGYMSGSTLALDNPSRSSMIKAPMVTESRAVPFAQSRKDSEFVFTPHTPETSRWSRYQRGGYQVPAGQSGHADPRDDYGYGLDLADIPSPNRQSHRDNRAYDEKTLAYLKGGKNSRPGTSESKVGVAITTDSPKANKKAQLVKDNWYVFNEAGLIEEKAATISRPPNGNPKSPSRHVGVRYEASGPKLELYGLQQPLRMNPPTPPPDVEQNQEQPSIVEAKSPNLSSKNTLSRATTVLSESSSSVYSESVPALFPRAKPSTPKGKYYGDLSAATLAVRGFQSPHPPPKLGHYGLPSPSTSRSPSPPKSRSPDRVVSRTGADIADEQPQWQDQGRSPHGMRNRREVSGKVAEEGRGGSIMQQGTWTGGRCR